MAAFFYAVTVVFNRRLAADGLDVSTVLGIRFAVAAAILLGILAVRRASLLPAPGERWKVLLLGVVGYGIESTFFFLALANGTTAAVSLLFYTYPAVVTVLDLVLGRTRADRRRLGALALSAAGSGLVVAAAGGVSISGAGIAFALLASVSFSLYLLTSDAVVVRTDALTTGAWIGLGAAIFMVTWALPSGKVVPPPGHWVPLLGNGIATAGAFALMFAALRRVGASTTAVVMTLEAFFATVLAAAFLGEGVRPLQAVGGAAILTATVLLARARRTPAEVWRFNLPTGR